ncbi:L-alanine exporter AlaE [Marivita sp.]|uniref:L-alanine exporter AlaE n=1 Tax=Marivita sp. TaxID=2003365 RepID=UPI0025BF2223|nr:L-alanine exporter AlaE [Marivita sp.]
MKGYFVDTLGAVVFFTTVAGFSELIIAGMHPAQVLIARLIMIPVMMLTGRPYGIWRDFVFNMLRPQRRLAGVICDILAFLTFQVPVYVTTLAIAGATLAEIVSAVGAAIVFMIVLSRPYGLFLDALRQWAGTSVR